MDVDDTHFVDQTNKLNITRGLIMILVIWCLVMESLNNALYNFLFSDVTMDFNSLRSFMNTKLVTI